MQRRQFIVAAGGLAAAGAGLLGPAAAAPADTPDIALFDGRFDDARRFGETQRRRGAAAFDIQADLARLWYGPLKTAVAGGRRPRIAGLATWADFVVAKGLARESGLRLTAHALHDRAASGRSGMLVSWVIS